MNTIENVITLLETGQHDKAITAFNEILHRGTDEEKFSLAEELFQFGFLEETKELIKSLLADYPDEGELFVLYAEACVELGEEEEAMLMLDKIENTDPSYPQALLLLADLYQMNGLYEVSEKKLLEAKEMLPSELVIDFAIGELYSEQGKLNLALDAYKKVVSDREEVGGVNINQRIADTLSSSGAFEEALPYYHKALESKLEINTLFGYAFTALQAGHNKTAIKKFLELKELDYEYHSLYLYLAKAYEQEEELEKAYEEIQSGIKQDEYNKDGFFYGAKLALKLRKEEEAEEYFRQAIALDPGFLEAAINLNKLLFIQERYEDILELISHIESFEEEEPQLIWDAATAYNKLEKYSEALNKYQQAYNFLTDQKEFLVEYGYFLIEEGKTPMAAEIFNKLLMEDPSNEEYLEIVERLTDSLN